MQKKGTKFEMSYTDKQRRLEERLRQHVGHSVTMGFRHVLDQPVQP